MLFLQIITQLDTEKCNKTPYNGNIQKAAKNLKSGL